VKHACIAAHRDSFPVTLMCEVLDVSPSGFYAAEQRQRRPLGSRAQANLRLQLKIRAAHLASGERYGAPKIHGELRAQGIPCGRHRVARLMRAHEWRGLCRRRFRVTTTQSTHREPVAPNVLARAFQPSAIGERDRVWAADITYLWTAEGWLYLAVVLDLGSRRVLGWCADQTLDQSLALRALEPALRLRRPAPGLVHHSDRGVQYASAAYQAVLQQHGIIPSMSRRGDCWDNAVVESFFATLKSELRSTNHWPTRAAAQQDLSEFIDRWYNHQRRHGSLGYRSPVQYERDLARLRSA
jgi:transposase InsO family protein